MENQLALIRRILLNIDGDEAIESELRRAISALDSLRAMIRSGTKTQVRNSDELSFGYKGKTDLRTGQKAQSFMPPNDSVYSRCQ